MSLGHIHHGQMQGFFCVNFTCIVNLWHKSVQFQGLGHGTKIVRRVCFVDLQSDNILAFLIVVRESSTTTLVEGTTLVSTGEGRSLNTDDVLLGHTLLSAPVVLVKWL